MAAGVTVQALADSLFLNPQLKAFKVQAGEVVVVYDLDYAKRLAATGLAAFPASSDADAPHPQAKAEELPESAPEAAAVEPVEPELAEVAEVRPARKASAKGRAAPE